MAVRHTAEDPTLWPDSRANADNYYVRNGYTAVEASVAAAAAAVRWNRLPRTPPPAITVTLPTTLPMMTTPNTTAA